MKKTLLTLSVLAGLSTCVHAQGVLGADGSFAASDGQYGSFTIDNTANSSGSDTAGNNGLVWIGSSVGTAVLLSDAGNQDVNIAIFDGSSAIAGNLIASLLLGAGDTGPAAGDSSNWGSPGYFYDGSGATYYDKAAAGGATETLTIEMWTGNNVAYGTPGTFDDTVTFSQALGNAFGTPAGSSPNDFTALPAVVLTPAPEPATLAVAGLGGLSMLLIRRRK